MNKSKVRDLGAWYPDHLNEIGDATVRTLPNSTTGALVTAVVRSDGTLVTLPPAMEITNDINDDGLVLGLLGSGSVRQSVLYDIKTSTVEPITIPGFPFISARAINKHGDVAGAAGRGPSLADDWRGFILERKTKTVTWVFPTIPLLPGQIPFLGLHDLNDAGHAIGQQGWWYETKGGKLQSTFRATGVFYDGTVTTIGSPGVKMVAVYGVTNNDRVKIDYEDAQGAHLAGYYDAPIAAITPFPYGRIIALNSAGRILWQEGHPGYRLRLTANGHTTDLDALFPDKSGWTDCWPTAMNESGVIIGEGLLNGDYRGFMLTPVEVVLPAEEAVARILWGVIQDGDGRVVFGGRLRRIPPRGPVRELLAALPDELRRDLSAAVEHARIDDALGAREFESRARSILSSFDWRSRQG